MVEAKRIAVLRRFAVRGVSIGTRDHLGAARLIIHQDWTNASLIEAVKRSQQDD
jgi:hypothetical protein